MNLDLSSIRYRRLDLEDKVQSFDCGDEDLNDFILNDALLYYKARLSTSYVVENSKTGDVIGYFSIAHDRISLTDSPVILLIIDFANNSSRKEKCSKVIQLSRFAVWQQVSNIVGWVSEH